MSENNNEKIKVLLFRPGEYARTVEIDDTLEGMQEAVGGWIEEYMPFEDDVAIVCNEEGKLQGLEFNRAIFNDEGQLLDVIAGDFFIAYAPPESEKYLSITPELEKKYKEKYGKPERIFFNGRDFESIKYDPDKNERSKDFER